MNQRTRGEVTYHGRYYVPDRSRVFFHQHSVAVRSDCRVRKQLSKDTGRIYCRITLLRRALSRAEPASFVLVRSDVHVLRIRCGNAGSSNHGDANSRTSCSRMVESSLIEQAGTPQST